MKRLVYLDSIRGIAALIVVISHVALVSPALMFDISYLRVLRAPDFAVDLFFVLSGFVLFCQLQNERPTYLIFLARRALRLFPPCFVAVFVSYAIYLYWAPSPEPNLSPWFNAASWPPGITPDQFWWHLSLSYPETPLLPPLWSLVYEWRISVIFPALVAIFLYAPKILSAIVLCLTIMVAATVFWRQTEFDWMLSTTFYGSFFLAGAAIARYQDKISECLVRWRYLRYAILAIVFYCVSIQHQSSGYQNHLNMGIMAALFIAVSVSDRTLQNVLSSRPLIFLGRISYSLYLWHFIVIGALFRIFRESSLTTVGLLCIIFSIGVAVVMYQLTELPFIQLSRKLSRVKFRSNFQSNHPHDLVQDDRRLNSSERRA